MVLDVCQIELNDEKIKKEQHENLLSNTKKSAGSIIVETSVSVSLKGVV